MPRQSLRIKETIEKRKIIEEERRKFIEDEMRKIIEEEKKKLIKKQIKEKIKKERLIKKEKKKIVEEENINNLNINFIISNTDNWKILQQVICDSFDNSIGITSFNPNNY